MQWRGSVPAGAVWPDVAGGVDVPPFRWIHVQNRAAAGSGADLLVELDGEPRNDPSAYAFMVRAGDIVTRNIAGPDDPTCSRFAVLNIGGAAAALFVEVSDHPIVHLPGMDSGMGTVQSGGGDGILPAGALESIGLSYVWSGTAWVMERAGDGKGYVVDGAALGIAGTTALMPAVAAKRNRVLSLVVSASAVTTVRLLDAAAVVASVQLPANLPSVIPLSEQGIVAAAVNTAFNIQSSAAATVCATATGQQE
jgi:hypothetical protein